MANYVFEELLSPLDFEHLVRDLISRDIGVELTAFAEGGDAGIDLRFSSGSKNIIVQCKRTKALSKEMLIAESLKVDRLIPRPKQYYLAISSEISVHKSNQIKSIFSKWIKSDKNIYSKNSLNNLLDVHKDIQQKHYKLWLNSSSIFNTFINRSLYERSKALLSDLRKDYKFYVKNESFNKAAEILNKHKFIIISGIPGIGKTTLAKLLLWEYLQKDYEIIEIRKVVEGEALLIEDSEVKQAYYFDDFLGENFLRYDVLEGRSNDLYQFIKRIMNNKNKVLIMTTREYILKQAKDKYERLNQEEFDIYKYTLDLSTYNKRIKSLILFNHLYYSNIDINFIENIIVNKTYKKIINHPNYSPRIIEQMTIKLNNIDCNDYSRIFLENLKNPFGIWNKSFESQISDGSKYTLYLLLSFGEPILLEEFKPAINLFFRNAVDQNKIDFTVLNFKNYLKELEDTFIKINITNKNKHYITFQNPSIKDFLINLIQADEDLIKLLINSSLYFPQFVYVIYYLALNFRDYQEIKKDIKNSILNRFDSLISSSHVYSDFSYRVELNILNKIIKLQKYIEEFGDKDLQNNMLSIFNTIEFKNLNSSDRHLYIEFFIKYKKVMKKSIDEIINESYDKISWFNDVQVFLSIRNSYQALFDKFIKINTTEFYEKITDAIFKEIEYSSNKESLNTLKENIEGARSYLSFSADLNIDYLINEIDNKIEIIEENNTSKENDLPIEKINESKEDDEFNEDTYFKIELFERT